MSSTVTTTSNENKVVQEENGKKRSSDEPNVEPSPRQRLQTNTGFKEGKSNFSNKKTQKERWIHHQVNEDYINFVGELMYPNVEIGPYGYDSEKGRFPIERVTTLGYLKSSLRKPSIIEMWSPYEVALFEGSITLYGKNFNSIQKEVKTKTVKEIIAFYYEWKKTGHYKQWKDSYKPDERDIKELLEPT